MPQERNSADVNSIQKSYIQTDYMKKEKKSGLGTEKSKDKIIESDVHELESKLTLWRPNEKLKSQENATSQANSITWKWKHYIEYDIFVQ